MIKVDSGDEDLRYIAPKPEVGPVFPGKGKIKVLFLNANPYRLGIANLGWQAILYYLLQRDPEVSVRVEYVDTIGNLNYLKFDVIAVQAPFETVWPNVPLLLQKSGLPLNSRERKKGPLVIAGGIYNPYPLSQFIDVFVMGEGRVAMEEIIEAIKGSTSKEEILSMLDPKKGFFVTDFIKENETVLAAPELPLKEFPVHTVWSSSENPYNLSPAYLSIMVALGCDRRCPFCVVSHCQGISRELPKKNEIDPEDVVKILNWRRKFIEVKIVKLFFASSVKAEKLKAILKYLKNEKVVALVGSLNIQQIDEDLIACLKEDGQDRIIIAPETNQRQRWKIQKSYISDERIFEVVELCNRYHLSLTLYLMYGLPGETYDDLIQLKELIIKVRKRLKKELKLEIHCNQLFPKPHTPFEYTSQIKPDESEKRFQILFEGIIPGIEIKTEDPYFALLQSLLSRGGKEMSILIENIAFNQPRSIEELIERTEKLGLRWQDYFNERNEIPWKNIIFQQEHEKLLKRYMALKKFF